MSTYTDASLIITPNAKKAGKLYALKGADLDVVRATTATYVGADGLIKTALANEVRFDYTNGSCPSILVEPQRTNLLTFSEQFNDASWNKADLTITDNATTAPDGMASADLILDNPTNSVHSVFKIVSGSAGVYTWSVFAKAQNLNFLIISAFTGAHHKTWFNLSNGTIGTNAPGNNARITSYENGWYRCSVSRTYGTGSLAHEVSPATSNGVYSYIGSGNGVYIWGAQLEAGSNATAYIPTVASAVTRNADVISKTGISGITSITETFENGTTNVIGGIPTSYTMSQGRIKSVIGI